MGIICDFCKSKFCYAHYLAENHGCGEEAKKFARSEWKQTASQTLTGDLKKPLKQLKKDQLKTALKKKIEQKENRRAKKVIKKDK